MKTKSSIVLGADSGGLELAAALRDHLLHCGYLVSDVSGYAGARADSLAIARCVAATVAGDEQTRGILVIGGRSNVAIAANQVAGARAVYISDTHSAERASLRDHANIVALSALTTPREVATRIVDTWLTDALTQTPTRQPMKVKNIDKFDVVYQLLEAVYG